jgi:DME family drug/metabolite transporter
VRRSRLLDGVSGRLCALAAGVLWSLAGVFIKSLDLHPVTLVFYRSLFAALLFLPFLRSRAPLEPIAPLLLSALAYTAAITAFVWANRLTTAANAIVLQYTAPFFVFFLRRCLGRSAARADRWALLFGMIGIAVIYAGSGGETDLPGVLVASLSGFLLALYMVNLESLASYPAATLMLWNNLLCCAILSPFLGEGWRLSRAELFALLAMGTVQLGLPYFLFSRAVARIPVQEASLIVLVEPVLNPIWVALVVGERPSWATLVGGAVILSGLAARYAAFGPRRPLPESGFRRDPPGGER